MVRVCGLLTLAFAFVLIGCGQSPAPTLEADPIHLGITLDGDTLSSADFRGDVVVVVVWASWCGPSRLALADLDTLVASFAPSAPVTVVAVSVDGVESDLRAYLEGGGHDFLVTRDVLGKVTSTFGIRGIPTCEILDPKGFPRSRLVGYQSRQTLEAAISEALFRAVP